MVSNLGIGLGAAADGFTRGYGLGQNVREDRRQRQNRRQLESIDTEGRREFAAQGGGDWDSFYSRVMVPRKAAALLEQGNLREAEAFRQWAENDGIRRGGRMFASGLIKGQAGDMQGALNDFIEAGKIKGYGGDFEIGKPEPIEGGGFRVMLKDDQGQGFPQEFRSADELLRFGATYLNPEAAFDQWRASQAAAAEFDTELAKEGAKLGLKLEDDITRNAIGLGSKPKNRDAIDYRKQATEELKDSPAFQDSSPEEQSRMIEERVRVITGEAAPATPKVLVDTRTGEVVDTPIGNAARKADRLPINRPEVAGVGVPLPRRRPEDERRR